MKNFKILLLLLLSTIQGCASQIVMITPFKEVNSEYSAQIKFINAENLYQGEEHSKVSNATLNSTIKPVWDLSAILYDQNETCTDGQIFPIVKGSDSSFKIPSGELLTFMLRITDEDKSTRVWCPNRFSFVPEAGEMYIAQNSIQTQGAGYCQVEVFNSAGDHIDLIAREKIPLLWTNNSPRCSKTELESPVKTKKSKQRFDCVVKVGGYSC